MSIKKESIKELIGELRTLQSDRKKLIDDLIDKQDKIKPDNYVVLNKVMDFSDMEEDKIPVGVRWNLMGKKTDTIIAHKDEKYELCDTLITPDDLISDFCCIKVFKLINK